MQKTGYIEIRITGSKGNLELSPDNYDIREIISILENAENLLYQGDKKDRPLITYTLEDGSVKHKIKTLLQYIIGFNAIIGQVNKVQNIDFLSLSMAGAFENIQNIAIKHDYIFTLKTSIEDSNEVKIDKETSFYRTESMWVDAEFYFYGKITNAGGVGKPNIHISTEEYGNVYIQTPISFFESLEENIIHKKRYGIRATGKQNSETGEIDIKNLKFLDIIDYNPKYDDNYLNELIEKASKSWSGILNKDAWLREIRGGYDA